MDFIDLPMTWAFLLAVAVFMYILLDGFDLGVGTCFPSPRATATATS
jgi:cytochrome d ubiquinol oxidase subunit II